MEFHNCCGINIKMSGTMACRTMGYSDGIVFGKFPLRLGQVFIVEIKNRTGDWNGDLRIGVSAVPPTYFEQNCRQLPRYALPDLLHVGKCWIFGLTDVPKNNRQIDWPTPSEVVINSLKVTPDTMQTCYGTYRRSDFSIFAAEMMTDISPAARGSRVGIFLNPVDNKIADMFALFNGEIFGPFAVAIPYMKKPLYPVVDVYGKTTAVELVRLNPLRSLKQLSEDVMRSHLTKEEIEELILPRSVKKDLLRHW